MKSSKPLSAAQKKALTVALTRVYESVNLHTWRSLQRAGLVSTVYDGEMTFYGRKGRMVITDAGKAALEGK
jgi:hypothetical protein